MAYFIPSYFQKRILRYALSRLELLDTDALDIEKLDLVWGKKTMIELRDVGLQLHKLVTWLKLPTCIVLNKGTIALLRLTVPADLYASGILLEIEGVDIAATLDANKKDGGEERRKKNKAGLSRGVKANMPRSTQPQVHDPGGSTEEEEGNEEVRLPTAVGLAESFLQNEGPRSKGELELAMTKSRSLESSQLSVDGEDASDLGLGTRLSLPTFLSDFLQGIVDRLQLQISRVHVGIDMNIDSFSVSPTGSSLGNPYNITFCLKIDSIGVNSISTDKAKSSSSGSRNVLLSTIRGHIVSEPSLFNILSQMSGPPSPIMHQKPRDVQGTNRTTVSSNVSSSDSRTNLAQSRILPKSQSASGTSLTSDRVDFPDSEMPAYGPLPALSSTTQSVVVQRSIPRESQSASLHMSSTAHPQHRTVKDLGDQLLPHEYDQSESSLTSSSTNWEADLASAELEKDRDVASSLLSQRLNEVESAFVHDQHGSSVSSHYPDPYESRRFAMAGSWDSPLQESSTLPVPTHRNSQGLSSTAVPIQRSSDTPPFEESTSPDDLMESRFFSHEEAESMYMSAISKAQEIVEEVQSFPPGRACHDQSGIVDPSIGRAQSHENDLYGSTNLKEEVEQLSRESDTDTKSWKNPDIDSNFISHIDSESVEPPETSSAPSSGSDEAGQTSGKDTASQGSGSSHQSNVQARISKEFLSVDSLSVTLPSNHVDSDIGNQHMGDVIRKTPEQYVRQGAPGSFSMHEMSASYDTSKTESRSNSAQTHKDFNVTGQPKSSETPIGVRLSEINVRSDLGLIKLMILAGQQLKAIDWDSKPLSSLKAPSGTIPDTDQPSLEINIDKLSSQLVDVLRGSLETALIWDTPSQTSTHFMSTPSNTLLVTSLDHLKILKSSIASSTRFDVSLQIFRFGYASEDVLAFDRDLKLREPTQGVAAKSNYDILMSIENTTDSSRIKLTTHPVKVTLDLAQLDETFSWFGGLSGVLELGNSMMSTVTIVESRPKTTRPRGVRFDEPRKIAFVEQPSHDTSRIKFDVKVGGLFANIQGKDSSLRIKSTAIKLVSRPEGVAVQVDKIKFTGPHTLNSEVTPIIIDFSNTRLEYLTYPKENDIDRLLDLLSPSRDKEQQDDGILLDTLISQRQQGGVVRLTIEECSGTVTDATCFDHFLALAEEFSKLSTVAKYLPEDDRPGILALCLVRKLSLDVNVNARFGDVRLSASNTEIAQVTLPSLFLLAVNVINMSHGDRELVGEALPVDKMAMTRKVPSLGVRFIGDEMEPTIKVKMWNARLDYHVSTLMAFMGLEEMATGEIIIADIVSSIATLKARKMTPGLSNQSSFRSGKSSAASRNLAFEVSIRDSSLGLNPRKTPSRALVLLADAQISGNVPNGDQSNTVGVLSINKASLMVVDKLESLSEVPRPDELPTKFISQASHFMNLGYVSICEISAAQVSWRVKPSDLQGEGSVEIEVRDELFVLETCADSTHTLQSVMNGLNPPSPPDTALKYRTEVGPVQDMLASLSADGFLSSRTVDAAVDTTSDADDIAVADDDTAGQISLIESVFGLDLAGGDGRDIGESYLDEDFETLANASVAPTVEDKPLLESYREDQQVDSTLEELEFYDDHFGADSGRGEVHKWNSDRNTFETSQIRLGGIPFRLNVKDVHIIWNLYDGYDWQTTRDTISQVVADVEHKAAERLARMDKRKGDEDDEESVIGDFLFNSIYIGIPANRDPRDLAGQVNRNIDDQASETGSYATSTTVRSSPGRRVSSHPRMKKKRLRLGRSKRHKMAFELKGVSVDLAVFAPSSNETQSSVDIRVEDLDIFDNVPTSAWRKFATYMHDAGQRQIGESMVHIEILTVKPIPDLAASEIVMTIKVLPLRLHVDQDALDFLTRFFEFKPTPNTLTTPTLLSSPLPPTTIAPPNHDLPFIQRAEIHAIPLKLDFKPKRVDYAGLRSGHTTEFMNLFILDQSNMVLRRCIVYGVSGFEKLGKTLNDIWMPDIKKTQLAGVLAGLAPVRSLVNVGGGVRELVEVPLREYRKDGRVLRSLSKGAAAFARTTTTEVARLGAKLAIGTQAVLQSAEDYFAPSSSGQQQGLREGWEDSDEDAFDSDDDGTGTVYSGGRVRHRNSKRNISLYSDPPANLAQGLRGAYRGLGRDLTVAKDAVVAIPAEVLESGSVAGGAKAVLRGAPMVILRPAIGVTRAVGKALQGATGSLDAGERRRVEDKYKRH